MFGYDQDWVAQDAVLGLNKAVIAGVAQAKDGSKVTVVDMTQLFNGREMGGQYAMTDPNDEDKSLIDTAWYKEGPDKVRGAFANSIMPGQAIELLCWDDTVMNGLPPGVGDCIGSASEALHPNWRGQAAEGQCIVAVVTGGIPGTGNGGNSCVRSVGDGTTTRRMNLATMATTAVAGDDTFCLMPSSTMDAVLKDEYTPCTGGDPDPTWDAKTWKRGEVSWNGNPTMWTPSTKSVKTPVGPPRPSPGR